MRFLDYSCFKPPQHDFSDKQHYQYSWSPVFGERVQPAQRINHAVCTFDNKIYMYGGRGSRGTLNQFWVFDCETLQWSEITSGKNSPSRLEGHSMVVYEGKIYIFGGETSFASADESPLWCYDIEERYWSKISSCGETMEPSGRRQHTAVLYMDIMCVYGGYQDLIGPTKEMWLFDFDTKSWHYDVAASSDSAPDGRYGHCAAVHGQSMWVSGGLTGLKPVSDVIVWNFDIMNWISVKTKGGPAELSGHSMSLADGSMYVFGGSDMFGASSNAMWRLQLSNPTWKKCHANGLKPPAVSGHSMIPLRSPGLLKKNFRTRSLPEVKKIRPSTKDAVDNRRSASCGKLSNDAKLFEKSVQHRNASTDKALLISPGDKKSDFAYDNPSMDPITPAISSNPPSLPAFVGDGNRGDYVRSRMKFGNITNGSSLKIFSYNLIDDSMEEIETSFIDVSNSRSSHVTVADAISGAPETPKKVGYPLITLVEPVRRHSSRRSDVELESIDSNDAEFGTVDASVGSLSPADDGFRRKNAPEQFRSRPLACESDNQFMMLAIGGKASSDCVSSKQFLMWRCLVTPRGDSA